MRTQRYNFVHVVSSLFIMTLLAPFQVKAVELAPNFNFEGLLLNSSNAPLTGPVTLKLQIYNASGSCLLFEETQSNVTVQTDGSFQVRVGAGTRASASIDGGLLWKTIFQNDVPISPSTNCPSYTPASGDARYLRVTVGSVTLSPDFALSPVPMATVAESLQGKTVNDFVSITGNQTMSGFLKFAQQNELRFSNNGANYVGFKSPVSNINAPVVWSLPSADGTSGQVLSTNGSGALSWTTGGGGGVTSVSVSAPLTVSNPSTTPNISISANSISNVFLSNNSVATGNIIDGTITDADISASAAISTSKLSGPLTAIVGSGLSNAASINASSTTSASTIVQRDATGGISANSASLTNINAAAATLTNINVGTANLTNVTASTAALTSMSASVATLTNVNIATMSVSGSLNTSGAFYVSNASGTMNIGSGQAMLAAAPGVMLDLQANTTGSINFITNAVPRMRITNNGYIGIGTTSPITALHVTGSPITSDSGLTVGPTATVLLKLNSATTTVSFSSSPVVAGSVATATVSLGGILPGDNVNCVPTTSMPPNLFWNCYVASSGYVEIRIHNAGATDYSAPTGWRITYMKF